MISNSDSPNQKNLLMPNLSEMLDPLDPIFILGNNLPWEELENNFIHLYSERGRPSKPIRLMVTLLLMQYMESLSDEKVVVKWKQNPYWQYCSGMVVLQHKPPCDPSELSYFRKRIGKNGAEKILQFSANLFSDEIEKEDSILVDTTVQEKNITYPTDDKLHKNMLLRLLEISQEEKINLGISSQKVKQWFREATIKRNKQARNKAKRARKKLKGKARVALEKFAQIMTGTRLIPYLEEYFIWTRALEYGQKGKKKVYSLHEPHVEAINKGKAGKTWEYGNKISVARTAKSKVIVGIIHLSNNKYDGNTLGEVLEQTEEIAGKRFTYVGCDRGYKGAEIIRGSRIISPQNLQKKSFLPFYNLGKNLLRLRSGIEATISYLKREFKMNRSFLKGEEGDKVNSLLSGAAHNIRKFMLKIHMELLKESHEYQIKEQKRKGKKLGRKSSNEMFNKQSCNQLELSF